MPLILSSSVLKVGNSHALLLPRVIRDNYNIKRGDSLDLVVTDNGIYIPLKVDTKKRNIREATKKWIKETENK